MNRELINLTDPTSQEYERLVEAAEKVGITVQKVNSLQREAEEKASKKLVEIEEIEKSIDGAEVLQLSADKNISISMILVFPLVICLIFILFFFLLFFVSFLFGVLFDFILYNY